MPRQSVRPYVTRHRLLLVTLGGVLTALALAVSPAVAQTEAGAPSVDAGYPALTLDASDYTFGWPETIEAGLTVVTMENNGHELHMAQLVRLKDGVAPEEALALLPSLEEDPGSFGEFPSILTFQGGPSIIVPGASERLILDLEPGTYAWICPLASDDGEPHFAKGMLHVFEVVAPKTEATVEEPVADATVTLQDFAFRLPVSIPAGPQRWEVANEGTQPHELVLVRLAPGATAMDFAMGFEDPVTTEPPPGMPMGGLQVIEPGDTAWLELDLAPGTYAALCFVPEAESGQPHIALGMIAEFTVSEEAG